MDAGTQGHTQAGRGKSPTSARVVKGSINLGAHQPVAHAIMFHLLTGAALVIFAPCVLVPIWRHVQKLGEQEKTLAVLVSDLNTQIEQNKSKIVALQADPQVIQRVARRELNEQPANEQHVSWSSAELAALRLNLSHDLGKAKSPELSTAPAWVDSLNRWLPAWAWSDLFYKSPNRELMLLMAGSLLLTAFVLYTPRAQIGTLPGD